MSLLFCDGDRWIIYKKSDKSRPGQFFRFPVSTSFCFMGPPGDAPAWTSNWGGWFQRPKGPGPLLRDAPAPPDTPERPEENAFEALQRLSEAVDAIRNPAGTPNAPARTCADLTLAKPDAESGLYWIDPNKGSSVDAIQVYCDMTTQSTCVLPSPSEVEQGNWYTGPAKRVWFGEDTDDGYPLTYKSDKIQMTFLQLLSKEAYQNITYHCRNSLAYFDKSEGNYDKALIFMTFNDLELEARGPKKFRYSVVQDKCKFRRDSWERTVFEFKTTQARRLPIVDFAPFDIGGSDQEFGLELGPVCFS